MVHAPAVWVFLTACLGVLPLAGYMGEATEHLAHRTSPTIGGLLNATFGNAAELIIAIVALRAGLVDLVKASITGSILGNLLLILGLAIIAGGIDRKALRFNRTSAGMSSGCSRSRWWRWSFRPSSTVSTRSERAGLRAPDVGGRWRGSSDHLRLLAGVHAQDPPPYVRRRGPPAGRARLERRAGRSLVLGAATVGVAVESELLVHAATAATEALGLSTMFLGLIIIPIIGNAAEHAAAVVLARKGQIELGLQIALGSSTQVALLVAPILVFAGVLMGREMNLVFQPFEVLAPRHGHHRDRHHHPRRRVALVRGGPAPGGVRNGGRGRLLSLI